MSNTRAYVAWLWPGYHNIKEKVRMGCSSESWCVKPCRLAVQGWGAGGPPDGEERCPPMARGPVLLISVYEGFGEPHLPVR